MTLKKEREDALKLLSECYEFLEKDSSLDDAMRLKYKIKRFLDEIESNLKKQKKYLCFTLTMPNVGSWNGRWSGQGDLYAVIRKLGNSKAAKEKTEKILEGKNFYHSWNDGWGANVEVTLVTASEAKEIRKKSKGFCGYDWMVDSILEKGFIEPVKR